MRRINSELRKVFIRMNKTGRSAKEISETIGVKIRTIFNWKQIVSKQNGERLLLTEPPKNTRKPLLDLIKLKQHIIDNPFAFNKEIAVVFGVKKSTIHKWRHRLGFKRKKAKTTHREADQELKKTFD